MKISIFTPTHDTRFLDELYESIKGQDFWEWVIVLNGEAKKNKKIIADSRVKYVVCESEQGFVGELKKFAAAHCSGDVLLEVDHDDLLTANAIAEVKKAFEDEEVGFVYSNFAEFKGNFEKAPLYDLGQGWRYRPFLYKGYELEECRAFAPTPAVVSRIWFAPNHLRAWRRSVYDAVGGHPADMRVLDDQDLLCRTFLATKMKHIDKCLYLYRIHGENSWIRFNGEIQKNTMRLYGQYIEQLARKWAKDQGLMALDFGGAHNPATGYEIVDITRGIDLSKPFPWKDGSVGVVRAYDFLEHIADKLHVIKEIYRVLAPGGYLLSMTPCALSQGAFQDPTHQAYYVENSFKYYTEKRFAQYIGTPVRFSAMSLYTTQKNSDGVAWVVAHLVALKGQETPGLINV